MASGPAVKFRFTGTRPASVIPTFANAPATLGGSSTPIITSSRRVRAQLATSTPPASMRP